LIFCRDDAPDILRIIQSIRSPDAAKARTEAPEDFAIPAGFTTQLTPTGPNVLGGLNIALKIVRGRLQVIDDFPFLKQGRVITRKEAELLRTLDIKPFTKGFEVVTVYDRGVVYDPAHLSYSEDQVYEQLCKGIQTIEALAAAAGLPTQASVLRSIAEASKLLALAAEEIGFSWDRQP
jgi:hypothetical protein